MIFVIILLLTAQIFKKINLSLLNIRNICRDIKNLDIESYLGDHDKNINQFKSCLNCINADNYNFIFGNFVKRLRSIIDIYTLLYQVSCIQKRLRAKPWLSKDLVSRNNKQKLYRSRCLLNDLDKKTFYKQYSRKLIKFKTKTKKIFYCNLF